MRGQWNIILGLLVAIIIAIFAVINVEGVRVNYLFGTAEWPLILVILGSVFMGAIVAGALGMVKIYRLQAELKKLKTLKGHQESAVKTESSIGKVEEDENTVIKDTTLDQDPK
ncbi:LapA family protein [Alkalihalophilus marmarensis]|uniref:LapA family protein n=1 Tax=Alkalihalophilus marmarensis TaxID=521377 RepID=UPI002DB6816B|nr:lipopolysaccharide assembly protein LapA domain-containing protein [Alkalihalophilus marmarensis]MEC2072124.1 lipopolysaccharide assembly protein LapA domain-containing protein [Alkalihalophilus marmarensis]